MITLQKEEAKEFKLALESGLQVFSVSDDGEIEFMGTKKEWDKFEELKRKNDL
jgi:hypothetical protein